MKQIRRSQGEKKQKLSNVQRLFFCIWTPLFITALCILWAANTMILPVIGQVEYTLADGTQSTQALPLLIEYQPLPFIAVVKVNMPITRTNKLQIIADDCLDELRINDKLVQIPDIPYCDSTNGRKLDLHTYLKAGENLLQMKIHDMGGKAGIDIRPAQRGLWSTCLYILFLASIALYGSIAIYAFGRERKTYAISVVFLFSCILLTAYSVATPYAERAYDVDGHIEYVQYVRTNLRIPPAGEGWQYYQPPLYYFIAGSVVRLTQSIDHLTWLSLFLSILSLTALTFIARILYEKAEEVWQPALFVALVSCLPGFVYFSSRVSNDTMLSTSTVLLFLFFIRWWKKGSFVLWYVSIFTLSTALLSKSNSLPLVPLLFLLLLFHPAWTVRQKIIHGMLGILLITVLSSWIFVLRFIFEDQTFIVGNQLSDGLVVKNSWSNLLALHPYKLLEIPFNQTWGDEYRRQFFWEFFTKSIYFGEWRFDHLPLIPFLARAILFLHVFFIPVTMFGFWKDIWNRFIQTLPIALTLLTLLGAAFTYRWISPYSPNQDFRFVPLLIVPMSYYLVRGIDELPGYLRPFCITCASVFVFLQILFLFLLIIF